MESRRSSSYLRRRELMQTLRVPTISEIKENLGLPLALTIFEESNEALKEDLGLIPHLRGPGGELWMSPSDLLIGKVCLKPPLTQKHVQALTHKGILDIGAEIEVKYWKEMELDKEEALREKEEYLNRKFELEKTRLLAETLEVEQMKHSKQLDEMRIMFENKINELIWACYEQVTRLEEQMQIEIDSLNLQWQEKLDEEIQSTVDRITEAFLEKLRLQEQVLVEVFTKQIRTLKLKHKCAADFLRIKSKEMMLQLRHKLQCQNVANLMYVLCKERKKCKEEQEALEQYYNGKIRKLKFQISKQANSIKRITRSKNRKQKQLEVREKCLVEILRQFQKFIYFALKASPTQGEFLLNIDRLIQFELDDYCIDKNKKQKTAKLIARKTEEKFGSSPDNETEDYLAVALASLSEDGAEEFEESDILPAFFFDENMYVREDFRDMFSAGIEIDMKHPLWNRDVEELLNIFREKMADKRSNYQVGKIKSHHSSVRFDHDGATSESSSLLTDDRTYTMKSPSPPSETSQSQQLPPSIIDDDEREIRKVSLAGSIDYKELKKENKAKKASVVLKEKETSKEKLDERKFRDLEPRMRSNSATQSKLTLARDSIILHISCLERKSLQNIAKVTSEEKEKMSKSSKTEEEGRPIYIKPSEDKERSYELSTTNSEYVQETAGEVKSIRSVDTPTASDSKRTSRLLLAQDSLELIKSTITVLDKEPEVESAPREGERKSQLTFNPQVVVAKGKPTPQGSKQDKPQKKKAASKPTTSKVRTTTKVVGSLKTKEHKQPIDEFTEERVKSLVTLMKKNPSLIRLFTKCSK